MKKSLVLDKASRFMPSANTFFDGIAVKYTVRKRSILARMPGHVWRIAGKAATVEKECRPARLTSENGAVLPF